MARAGTPGDELMLRAVADRLGVPVNIATSDAFMWCVRPAAGGAAGAAGAWLAKPCVCRGAASRPLVSGPLEPEAPAPQLEKRHAPCTPLQLAHPALPAPPAARPTRRFQRYAPVHTHSMREVTLAFLGPATFMPVRRQSAMTALKLTLTGSSDLRAAREMRRKMQQLEQQAQQGTPPGSPTLG